jgi:hypothetical protein
MARPLAQLLPRTAAAGEARSAPIVALPQGRVDRWLTDTLKRVNKGAAKRPLNSAPQHHRCLVDTLGGKDAIWLLATLAVPKARASELRHKENPITDALENCKMIYINAYVVSIDLVSLHVVDFKLTPETIAELIAYYKDVYLVDSAAEYPNWPDKEEQLKTLEDNFVASINRYSFRTEAQALEGMEEGGAGELLQGRSERVKTDIVNLLHRLQPPPPPPPMMQMMGPMQYMMMQPGSQQMQQRQQQWYPSPAQQQQQHMPPPENWQQHHMLASQSSPSPVSPDSLAWSPLGQQQESSHLASPASSYTQSYSTPTQYCSPPVSMSSLPHLETNAILYSQPHCGVSAVVTPDYANCGWALNDMMAAYPIQI